MQSIPVTITQSLAAANSYTVKVTSDSDHQTLNISGNFTDGGTYHVTAAIDYRNKTVSVSGPQKSKTFSSFPEDAAKGSLYMGIYPAEKADFTMHINKKHRRILRHGQRGQEHRG